MAGGYNILAVLFGGAKMTDHDLLIRVDANLTNHLKHHLTTGHTYLMIGMVVVGSFVGPILVRLIFGG